MRAIKIMDGVRLSATAEMRFWRFVGRTAITFYPPGSRMPRTYRKQPQGRGLLIAEYRWPLLSLFRLGR